MGYGWERDTKSVMTMTDMDERLRKATQGALDDWMDEAPEGIRSTDDVYYLGYTIDEDGDELHRLDIEGEDGGTYYLYFSINEYGLGFIEDWC